MPRQCLTNGCVAEPVPGRSRCAGCGGGAWARVPPARQAAYADLTYRRLRAEILASKPPCSYPGCPRTADTIDHVLSVARGGGSTRENLRPMCRRHNEALGGAAGRAALKARARRKQ